MDKKRFAVIIAGLSANFGGGTTDVLVETWWRMLEKDGITADQFAAAAEGIIRTRKYKTMPTYAEIAEAVHGSVEDRAQVEASKVLNAVRVIGFYGQPKFDDPVTADLMSSRWRWQSFCQTLEESKVPFWTKEFIEAYRSHSKTPIAPVQIGHSGGGRDIRQLTQNIGK